MLCHRQHISAKPRTTPAPALAPDPIHPIPHLSPALATITFSPASARLLRALLPTQLFAHKRTWIPEEKISPMCSFIGRIKGKGVSQQVWWNPHLQSHSSALGGFPEQFVSFLPHIITFSCKYRSSQDSISKSRQVSTHQNRGKNSLEMLPLFRKQTN